MVERPRADFKDGRAGHLCDTAVHPLFEFLGGPIGNGFAVSIDAVLLGVDFLMCRSERRT